MRRLKMRHNGCLGAYVVAAMFVGTASKSYGQESKFIITHHVVDVGRLSPATPPAVPEYELQFKVDVDSTVDEGEIGLRLWTPVPGLMVTITGPPPTNEIINRQIFPDGGWRDAKFEIQDNGTHFFLGSFSELGWHYEYNFPTIGPGDYTVHFEAPSSLATEEAVIVRLNTNSPLGASAALSSYRVKQGTPVIVSGVLLESGQVVGGATVSAWVTREGDTVAATPTLVLQDNGQSAFGDFDDLDGIYSNIFAPDPAAQPGTYHVVVEFTGSRLPPNSNPFFRRASKQFEIYAPQAVFSAPPGIAEATHDDNENGLYERLSVSANVDVAVAGFYSLRAMLASPTEKTATYTANVNLPVGNSQTVSVDFPFSTFLEWNESGSYKVRSLKLFYEGPSGIDTPSLTDILEGDLLTTAGYDLANFDGTPIRLTGVVQENTLDTEPDSDIDELHIDVGVTIFVPGSYEFSAQLFGQCPGTGAPLIPIASSTGTLVDHPGGTTPITITLVFAGTEIKRAGLSGPYEPKNLIITGIKSLVSENLFLAPLNDIFVTQPYPVMGFDGTVLNCNGGDPDACEIAANPNLDCDFNDVLDSCTPVQTGACCDDTTESCTDSVAPCNCNGKFTLGQTCAQLSPLCTVACCQSNGDCDDLSIAGCDAANGVPVEGRLCSTTQCFGDCYTATNCCFGEQSASPGVVGCNNESICSAVCAANPLCCQQTWGAACVDFAISLFGTPTNCNANTDPAFPANPLYDVCELQALPALDCQPNGIIDSCEIVSGTADDCNENGVPDSCETFVTGACCDEQTVTCVDDVLPCDCSARFEANVACGNMIPPCTAACCIPNGPPLPPITCTDFDASSCAGANGQLTPGVSCADQGFSCPSCANHRGCCNDAHDLPCCFDALCSQAVCQIDPYCCTVKWDALCVSRTDGLPCPSSCVPNAPLPATGENSYSKNRYITFIPNNGVLSHVAFRVDKQASGTLGGPAGQCWVDAPNQSGNSRCVPNPVFRPWPETLIHVGDCEIVPVASYQVVATYDGTVFSSPLSVPTILEPTGNSKKWGDVVGVNNGVEWTAPNLFTNVNDVLAVLAYLQAAQIRPTFQRANLQAISSTDSCLNAFVNTADVNITVKAVAGDFYGAPSTAKVIDPALCRGACCDTNQTCFDNVDGCACVESGGQFHANQTCSELGPEPCGNFFMGGGGMEEGMAGGSFGPEGMTVLPTFGLLGTPYQISASGASTINVYLDAAHDISAYEVSLDVTGGTAGTLTRETIAINTQLGDYIFAGHGAFLATNVATNQAGAAESTGAAVAAEEDEYLATFTLRASGDAYGVFEVRVSDDRSFVLDAEGIQIAHDATTVAYVRVGVECTGDLHCDDADGCTNNSCMSGVCQYTPVTCNDNDGCTTDTCANDECQFTPVVCNDNNVCTSDACVSNACAYTPVTSGTACNDGLYCTQTDTCNGSGVCVGSSTSPCVSPNPKCCEADDSCHPKLYTCP